jgi:uncharacterized alkaline shock family protein YloU
MISYETRLGKINISDEYLQSIIGEAVTSCYGVSGMVASGSKQRIVDMFTKKDSLNKGIIIRGNADSIVVELHIIVLYGMNINAIAKSIVNKVQYTVKELTGINVDKVIVKVDGIKE